MNNKPIYLVITPFFPTTESFRGPYVYDQVKAIERDGHYRVVVMKPCSWMRKENDYEYGGIKVFTFTTYELPTNIWPGSGDCLSIRSFDKALRRIGIKYEDIAVVHAHVTYNAKYANYLKAKNPSTLTALQHHGYDVIGYTDGRFADKEWHKKRCINYSADLSNQIDLHIGVSQQTLNYLAGYKDIKIKNSYVLYNGVDCSKFFRMRENLSATSSLLNVSSNKLFIIGCVANFWDLKDQITLIKAVELLVIDKVQNIKVIFIGTGFTREECEQYVNEHNLSGYFEFRNEMDHRQLNEFYNTLDLFVLPSYWDALGCVYTEAYACGVPFMSAEGSGITEYISQDAYDRWVIKPHDFEQLADNIKWYIETREPQKLNYSIDINVLVKDYLDNLLRLMFNSNKNEHNVCES